MNKLTDTPGPEPVQNTGVIAALRVRPFSVYVTFNSLFMIGTWMQRLGVGWLTWEITQSEIWLGMVGACEFLPVILLGPFAGLLADRARPLPIILIGNSIRVLQAVLLTIVGFSGAATPEVLLALMVVAGMAAGAVHPSRLSLVSQLVPQHLLATAIPLDSLGYNVARFIGPAIGGVLLLHASISYLFLANVFCFLPLVGMLVWLLRRSKTAEADEVVPQRERKSAWQELKEGVLYVRHDRRLASVVVLLGVSSIFLRPLLDMLPAFVDTILKAGPSQLATLVSAYGIGSLIGGFSVAMRHGRGSLEVWHLTGSFFATLGAVLFLQSTQMSLAIPFAILSGAGITVTAISGQTILQTTAQSSYRGRVMSLYSMLYLGGPALGAPLIGFLAERISLPSAFDAGILINVIMWALCVWSWVKLSRRDRDGRKAE